MYDLLKGVRIVDVSLLAPSMLGMRLAELGADVIKVEQPPYGDRGRIQGPPFRKMDGVPSIRHFVENRGKRSLGLNLGRPGAKEVYLDLVKQADAVLIGIRPQSMDKWGLSYEEIKAVNPRIVYCVLSGMGSYGPYKELGTHGMYFDAYAGLTKVAFREEDGLPYIGEHKGVGTNAGALFATIGVLAAIIKARASGVGSRVEVAETDAAVLFQILAVANIVSGEPWGAGSGRGSRDSVRYQNYETKDGKYIMFFPIEAKFWITFCELIGRKDFLEREGANVSGRDDAMSNGTGDEYLRKELTEIFKTRTQAEWTQFFLENNVPGGPVNDLPGAVQDPHFLARDNVFEQDQPEVGKVRMMTTPIKVVGQEFGVRPAPTVGEHNQEILTDLLGYDSTRVDQLREAGAIN